ncbi:hypothetical protein EYF80_016114 [Liparis tanakae]|uniref:Uncharacterized protein n=1 Tax=Liparis tanakae TaxID=230148 RepID=A0A4Z2I8P2_9TELE|nr:hypothetical protein EYF80_016114 [Liparis tanakae]
MTIWRLTALRLQVFRETVMKRSSVNKERKNRKTSPVLKVDSLEEASGVGNIFSPGHMTSYLSRRTPRSSGAPF